MLSMQELVDLRMQQHIAQEIYRQQIMQRIPDPFPAMIPMHMSHHVIMPPRPTLPGVEAKLENNDLWQQFHKIGTEMIITKSGRRMFPSQRLSLTGLEDDSNYCVLLEMVPIGDCRYKFSGSQWVPAGGAEPQSPQRMYLHPDSPATGAHWKSQPILFNKVKLTNNTLDNNGHVVLASMHKYQPRIHVIRTSDLTQIPWAPQQAFVFAETEFVAVTAYQNDRITKLKIDNNPFAKGFRETGQSRCKRKLTSSSIFEDEHQADHEIIVGSHSPLKPITGTGGGSITEDDRSSIGSFDGILPPKKHFRSNGSFDDESSFCSSNNDAQRFDDAHVSAYHPLSWIPTTAAAQALQQQQSALHQHINAAIPLDFIAPSYFMHQSPTSNFHPMLLDPMYATARLSSAPAHVEEKANVSASKSTADSSTPQPPISTSNSESNATPSASTKRSNFSISAILAY